ncbi:MAG: DUF1801 domain-containing protein [Bacteroidota bacterium]
MNYDAATVEEYLEVIPEERKPAMNKLRDTVRAHIPKGFKECIQYKMIGYVVPHSRYPDGYHCNPKDPLPFVNIASQKNYIALYHSGIYADPDLLEWFREAYPKHSKRKLNMGKSCIRFKKMDDIPYELIGELMEKITVDDWVSTYEEKIKK